MRAIRCFLSFSALAWLTAAWPAVAQTASAEIVRERLWIWGHPAGVYNASYLAACPTKSSIEPVAAAQRMGITNMIFVRYDAKPAPPFAAYYEPFQPLRRVYWSLVGAGGATSADEREHVYRLAEANANITGFILDDFFHETAVGRGRHMYDFDAYRPLPVEAMKLQTETGFGWLKAGRTQSMVFLPTPNVDVGLEAVNWTRTWIASVRCRPLRN